jgi:DNA polymerase III subunit beta
MEFVISKNALQKELGFVQGIVEKKNTIPVLSNILIESMGDGAIRITGTDLDTTLRCQAVAEIQRPGTLCVQARKLFEISRLLPDAPVSFRKEENDWATVKCERSMFRVSGVPRENFPEIPAPRSSQIELPAQLLKSFIDRTIFAITLEESRYTLSGAKLLINKSGIRMVTTDGHRLAFIEKKGQFADAELDILVPRKTLAELARMTAGEEGAIQIASDENHVYFEVGGRHLISRLLTGQFPNYEMVIPKDLERRVLFDGGQLNHAIKRVAVMADDRSRAVRFQFGPGRTDISAQSAEEGEACETLSVEYQGDEFQIGFNAQYLQDFLTVAGDAPVYFELKSPDAQVQLRKQTEEDVDYKYIVMPLRL